MFSSSKILKQKDNKIKKKFIYLLFFKFKSPFKIEVLLVNTITLILNTVVYINTCITSLWTLELWWNPLPQRSSEILLDAIKPTQNKFQTQGSSCTLHTVSYYMSIKVYKCLRDKWTNAHMSKIMFSVCSYADLITNVLRGTSPLLCKHCVKQVTGNSIL